MTTRRARRLWPGRILGVAFALVWSCVVFLVAVLLVGG
jgi:hypothetical protein